MLDTGRLWQVPLREHKRPGIVLLNRPIQGSRSEQGHTCRTLRGTGSVLVVGTSLGNSSSTCPVGSEL